PDLPLIRMPTPPMPQVANQVEQDIELAIATPATPTAPSDIQQIVVHGPQLDVTRIGDDTIGLEHTPPEPLMGLESTRLEEESESPRRSPGGSLLGLEVTSLDTDESSF